MAEPTRSPSLPSTADATPYVPVSWAAAAAATVAVAFVVTLIVLGYFYFESKKPLLMGELLVLPAIAIVLSFAARRMIRNSEGTRTEFLYGVNLVNGAWWTALIVGLCYVAYLFAIDFAIRRDANGEIEKWIELVRDSTEEGRSAFHRTLKPGARQSLTPEDKYKFELTYRDELLVFRHTDLFKLAQRNRDSFEYIPAGVTWLPRPGSIEAVVAGTVKCPEGTFPILIPMNGTEAGVREGGGGRQWTLIRPQSGGFIDERTATRTEYGWLIFFLEKDGGRFGKDFLIHLLPGPPSYPYAFRAFVARTGDRAGWKDVALTRDPNGSPNPDWTRAWQLAFAAPTRLLGDAGYADDMEYHFFKLPGGADPSPAQKAAFFASWNSRGVRPAGDKLKDGTGAPIDKEDTIAVTETAIEVRVPIEIPLVSTGGKDEVARGRVVVVCTDPALLDELKRLKASANPDRGANSPNEDLIRRKVPWRVMRIESDMAPVNVAPRVRTGGAGMPGGMHDGPPGG